MKKGYVKLLLISLIITIILLIDSVTNMFSLFTYSLFLLIAFLLTKKSMGFEDDDFKEKKEITMVLLSGILLYYIITYGTVFFWGILKSRFVLTFTTFFNTIIPLFLIIIFTELLRYIVIRKGRRYKGIWVLSVILFSLIEIVLKTRGYDFSQGIQILKFLLEIVAVVLSKNIFLCYLTNRVGYKPSILFRLLYDFPLYFLPFFPSLGIFIDSILKIVFPNILLFILVFRYSNYDAKDKIMKERINKKVGIISTVIVIVFALIVVGISSAKFRIFSIVVGSSSMSPNIDKGDVVLVKKTSDITSLKENDILVFAYENLTIIHRIIRIEEKNNELLFYTKGDSNESEDYYPVLEKDIVGKALFKIKYIGYPTIWINEQIK